MSIFASFTKKSKLDAAAKKAAKARSEDDGVADQLLKEVYQDYADIVSGDPLRAAAFYQWGVTLLHQAKNKTPPESINIYRNAIAKFSFCMTIDPNYLAAAIDAGVACMDLARAREVEVNDELYEMAKRQFDKANLIQAGAAAYNLACIHGVRNEPEACLAALKLAKEHGLLPEREEIYADPDLANVKDQDWFNQFFADIDAEKQAAEDKKKAEKLAAEAEAKEKKAAKEAAYDPYKPKQSKVIKAESPDTETNSETASENTQTDEGASSE